MGRTMSTVDPGPNREVFEIYPIKRVDVFESVLAQLDRLVETLQPGDRLPPERELVSRLQVSRVSVREALRRLESLGRIEIRRNAGSFVRDPSSDPVAAALRATAPMGADFLQHLTELRAAIEDRVVALVGSLDGEQAAAIESALSDSAAEMLDADSDPGSLDLRFEAALGRLVGNPLLVSVQRSVHQLWIEAWTSCGVAPGNRQRLHAEHEAIFRALREGDTERARSRMAEHVDRKIGSIPE